MEMEQDTFFEDIHRRSVGTLDGGGCFSKSSPVIVSDAVEYLLFESGIVLVSNVIAPGKVAVMVVLVDDDRLECSACVCADVFDDGSERVPYRHIPRISIVYLRQSSSTRSDPIIRNAGSYWMRIRHQKPPPNARKPVSQQVT